jgi:inosose dehydratase
MISVANAPISYGAFELTVGIYPNVPDGVGVLDRVKDAGYAGIDLGPVGYLGLGDEIAENLRSRELGLTGGYLELPFHDPEAMPPALAELATLIDVFDAAAPVNVELGLPAPRPTIAVVSLPYRRAVPGRAHSEPELGYSEEQWATFAGQAEIAAKLCRDRGYSPVFHNETGTNVEAPWELEKVLEMTSFDLCLDTGHLIICGGDPVASLRKWSSRVTHIHVKSAYRGRMQELIDARGDVEAIWAQRVFAPLGEGDLDLAALAEVIRDIGYSGWIVVEQDIFPDEDSLAAAEQDQRNNRAVLRDLGF